MPLQKVARLVKDVDTSGSGVLGPEEFLQMLHNNQQVKPYALASQCLCVECLFSCKGALPIRPYMRVKNNMHFHIKHKYS